MPTNSAHLLRVCIFFKLFTVALRAQKTSCAQRNVYLISVVCTLTITTHYLHIVDIVLSAENL